MRHTGSSNATNPAKNRFEFTGNFWCTISIFVLGGERIILSLSYGWWISAHSLIVCVRFAARLVVVISMERAQQWHIQSRNLVARRDADRLPPTARRRPGRPERPASTSSAASAAAAATHLEHWVWVPPLLRPQLHSGHREDGLLCGWRETVTICYWIRLNLYRHVKNVEG